MVWVLKTWLIGRVAKWLVADPVPLPAPVAVKTVPMALLAAPMLVKAGAAPVLTIW